MKPVKVRDEAEVLYSEERWQLLRKLRSRARPLLTALPGALLVGSVARGDVHDGSDVDVALLEPVAPSLVEERLVGKGFQVVMRELVQATPLSTPKLYIHVGDNAKVSVPLARLSRLEEEFYRFAGSIDLAQLERGERVPGVNKRLLAVIPTPRGHIEFSVVGREEEVARMLGVSVDIVEERVGMLTRRDERGRTGLYVRLEIPVWESPEEAIARAARRIPALRDKLEGWL